MHVKCKWEDFYQMEIFVQFICHPALLLQNFGDTRLSNSMYGLGWENGKTGKENLIGPDDFGQKRIAKSMFISIYLLP